MRQLKLNIVTALAVMAFAVTASFSQNCSQNLLASPQAAISSSGTNGLCTLCSVNNTSKVIDTSTSTAATISIPLGVTGNGYIEVNLGQTYTSGTRVGFLIDVNGGVASALNSITLTAYSNSTSVGSFSGSSLLNVVGLGGRQAVSAIFCSNYNRLKISCSALVGVLATYNIYGVFVEDDCNFPGACPGCNTGINAPALSATTKANGCSALTVDLTTITASNTPVNTTLSWHTGTPCTAANVISNANAVNAGTYYAGFYDAANNCYSGSAATAVTATVNPLLTAPNIISSTNITYVGGTVTLSSSANGGVWTSSNTGIATVDASQGVVTGIAPGSVTITYTITNVYGCSASSNVTITINPKANG